MEPLQIESSIESILHNIILGWFEIFSQEQKFQFTFLLF